MPKNWNSQNIDTTIVKAEPLISTMIENHGGQCDCVAFLRASSQEALEEILAHTHQKKNKNTVEANSITEAAKTKQKQQYISLARSDDDINVTRHRLPHTKNRITVQQPIRRTVNYVKRWLGDEEVPTTIIRPNSERTFETVLEKLPIQPKKISDDSLRKLGLTPDNFDTYCRRAREIYKESIWKKIAHILSLWRPVLRSKEQGRSSRIMQIHTLNWETRYILFINQDALYYHQTPSRETQHKVVSTSFAVFENYDELLRSQEYAIQNLSRKITDYNEWQSVLQNVHVWDKQDTQDLLQEAIEYFDRQKWFYAGKVANYLKRETKNPRKYMSHALRNLYNALQDLERKNQEIKQVYQNLAKWREKIIMEDVHQTAQLINR